MVQQSEARVREEKTTKQGETTYMTPISAIGAKDKQSGEKPNSNSSHTTEGSSHSETSTGADGIKIAQLQQADIDAEAAKWEHAIILYAMGATPSIGAVERFLASQWKFTNKPKVFLHNEGYFIIHFNDVDDCHAILYSGPHTLNNKPAIVKPWTPDFDFHSEVLTTIPLWVKLPNLPLSCWGIESLSRIGSTLSKPLYADECTSHIERVPNARLLIQVDITKELPNTTKVKDPKGQVFEQAVNYDWKPEFYQECLQLGHKCQPKQVPKQPVQRPPNPAQPAQPAKEMRRYNKQEWHNKGVIEIPKAGHETTTQQSDPQANDW
ncbi:uncharacterized protein LOC132042304 [Lycium ferocissimum]|uniref:uncharacterized protein LOC132042304 n=1 Tax=Lycium ferocissimum TaxID=112874 RepID=UPI0028163E88|nr:uncharacterized protein LOC132042304 [Lycium ferocissimum]